MQPPLEKEEKNKAAGSEMTAGLQYWKERRRMGGWKEEKSGADERRWMDGYVRNGDRWGATRRVDGTPPRLALPPPLCSLYNDTLRRAINKSMANTCSPPSIMGKY